MRILMFNNEFPPLGGGTGTVNFELFNIFKDIKDLKIDLITSAAGKNPETEQFSENIRIFRLPVGKKNIHHASNPELIKYAIKATFSGFKLYKEKKYDIILVWSTVPAGLPALFLKIFKKIPYAVRVGGPDIPGFEKRYFFIYKIISPLIKLIWKNAELIIAKCRTEKTMIKEINSELNVKVIYNGINNEKFKPAKKQLTDTLKIICPARLIKRKGQYTLIDAVLKLKKEDVKIEVNFIGEGDEKDNYVKLTGKYKLEENITFSGYIAGENMPEEYRKADVFVLPSYNEGMSNALLEAMSCGLPVIVTDVGGTEELVDEKNGFIFKAGDSAGLTKILKHISENKEIINKLGQNSRKKVENFNWENIANEYLQLFNEVKQGK